MIGGFDFGPDRIVLGLFTGLTYGLLAVGLVLVYRSSRFVNFAHGAVGVFGAAVLGRLVGDGVLPYWLALPVGMLAAAAVSGAIELSVVRRLRHRPRVIGMIATLGLSQFVLVLALLVNSSGASGPAFPAPPGMPSFTIGNTPVGPAFTAMLLLTPVLLVGLAMFLKRSTVRAGDPGRRRLPRRGHPQRRHRGPDGDPGLVDRRCCRRLLGDPHGAHPGHPVD